MSLSDSQDEYCVSLLDRMKIVFLSDRKKIVSLSDSQDVYCVSVR